MSKLIGALLSALVLVSLLLSARGRAALPTSRAAPRPGASHTPKPAPVLPSPTPAMSPPTSTPKPATIRVGTRLRFPIRALYRDREGLLQEDGAGRAIAALPVGSYDGMSPGLGGLEVGGGNFSTGMLSAMERGVGLKVVATKGSARTDKPGSELGWMTVRKGLIDSGKVKDAFVAIPTEYAAEKDPALNSKMQIPYLDPDGKMSVRGMKMDLDFFMQMGYYTGKLEVESAIDTQLIDYAAQQLSPYK